MSQQRSHRIHLGMASRGHAARMIDLFENNAGFGNAQSGAAKLLGYQCRQPA
jgi:hypothetical protein